MYWWPTEELLYETTKYCTDPETAAGKAQRYHSDPVINLHIACHAPHDDSTQKFNREGRHFLTTDGRPAGRNSEEILHRPTNPMETASRYRTNPEINWYTACRVPLDDLTRKLSGRHFLTTDGHPAGQNSEEILHHPTNSTETARRCHIELPYDRHHDKHHQKIKVGGPC